MFVNKSNVALNSILRAATGDKDSTTLPTDLSILRDETSGRLIATLSEVVTKLAQMETVALPGPHTPSRSSISLARPRPTNPYLLRPDEFRTNHPGYNA